MNDIILSSLINLFALFGSSNGLDAEGTQGIIKNYLKRHFGIRNPQSYMNLYNDLRGFYDETPDLDKDMVVAGICSKLQARISAQDQILMLLRLMEFCGMDHADNTLFGIVADNFKIDSALLGILTDYVQGIERPDNGVLLHEFGMQGEKPLRTLYLHGFNLLLFTYTGRDIVLMEDIPVMPGVFQVWEKCGVLKCSKCQPAYYSVIMKRYESDAATADIELCGRDINFRFANNPKFGMHDLSFTLHGGELVAIMGGSGTGKSTLLSILTGGIIPQEGTITINGHSITESDAKSLIGFVPQDDLLIEELTVYQNLWYTAKLCFDKMPDDELDRRVMATLTDLGLDQAKDLKVGSPINKYI